MRVRLPVAVLAAGAAFAGGVALSHFGERDAHAQPASQPASVYVPADGLTFRAIDGRVIARLAYDRRGGSFEVYDDRERPSAVLRGGLPDATRASAGSASTSTVPAASPSSPLSPPSVGYVLPPGAPDLGY